MKTDILIIRGRDCRITLAREDGRRKNLKVLLVGAKKKHIGGYYFDYQDPNGIFVASVWHPHIFRTDSEQVYNFSVKVYGLV